MRSKCLPLLTAMLFGCLALAGQPDAIPCDLSNLYQITLAKSPTLQRQQIQNRRAKADKQSATSLFDYQLYGDLNFNRYGSNLFNADPRTDIIGRRLNTSDMQFSSGVRRTFRSGLTAALGVDYLRSANNYPYNAFNESVGAFVPDHSTGTTLSLTQPLLRGRGAQIVTAYEEAAAIGIENQLYQTAFITSGELYGMAAGYWQYLTAEKALGIYRDNENRIRKVLDITTELVKAEKKPEADLLQVQADLKDKERQTILAAQELYAARQNLGRALGLNTAESDALSLPLNDFPVLEETPVDTDLPGLLEIARQRRADLIALHKALDMLEIYQDVAENNIKPQLDLKTFLSYGGASTGSGLHRFFSALGETEGRNYQVGVGLNFLFPVNNNRAEAELLTSQLQYGDQEIQIRDQIRNIELNVGIAFNNLQNSIEALKKSKEALIFYEEVFSNEQVKFQTGLTTLLNLILFQERLTFAQLDYIQNQQRFALAISKLRYETGTLFSLDQAHPESNSAYPELFYTLPRQ